MFEYAAAAAVVGVLGFLLFRPSTASAATSNHPATKPPFTIPPPGDIPGVTPKVPPAATFPIPSSGDFTTRQIQTGSGVLSVAAFLPATRLAMVQALTAREWRVMQAFSPTLIQIGPPDLDSAANADVMTAVRIALAAGVNVYFDADLAQKLTGGIPGVPDPTVSANFMALAQGLALPEPESGNEEVAMTVQAAKEALQPDFPNTRFVLFALAGENV